ncbi:MAG: HD domain-containing protein [Chloroflexi bacterium]|nr:MAG: HD domain-containing protein [Chloroflexota bacterium]
MRFPIRYKIILPFAVLLIFVGVIGTGVATGRLTNAASTEFDGKLLYNSFVANQSVSLLEAERVRDLSQASNTIGVPAAIAAADTGGLAGLLTPIAAVAEPANLKIRVLNASGNELLGIQGTPSGPNRLPPSASTTFATVPDVISVLKGQSDALGERRLFLFNDDATLMLYWVTPVRADDQRIVGAMLVGQSVSEVAASDDATRAKITADKTARLDATGAGHSYGSLFSTWTMRGRQLGYLAVQANADGLQNSVTQVRLILTLVFTAAALLTLLVGGVTASLLTGPVDRLVRSMRTVSGGDLHHRARVKSRDEIGFLAKTFNEMTASLEEKTAALEETYFASMETLARAIDARDPSTFGHSARVAAISMEIADAIGLPAKEREALRRGALLHDIGKIGVEDRVLNKPGPLSDPEADHMREHPRIGYDMLKGLRFLEPSLPNVLSHHERWDGAGYPTGLTGTAIPLPVRILAVADVFDALTSTRPYRKRLGFEAAATVIRNGAGLQFDPDVVSAFLARRGAIVVRLQGMGKVEVTTAEPEAA